MRIAASNIDIYVVFGIQAVHDFLKTFDLLHLVEYDIIGGFLRNDTTIQVRLQGLAVGKVAMFFLVIHIERYDDNVLFRYAFGQKVIFENPI